MDFCVGFRFEKLARQPGGFKNDESGIPVGFESVRAAAIGLPGFPGYTVEAAFDADNGACGFPVTHEPPFADLSGLLPGLISG